MPVEQIPTLAEAVVQHGAGALAVATVIGMFVWAMRTGVTLFNRFAERILTGDGNGGASLKKAVEAAEAAATSAHEAALSSAQVVSQMADLERRQTQASEERAEHAEAIRALTARVSALRCLGGGACDGCGGGEG